MKSLELVKNEEMDALNCLKEKEKKGRKRKLTKDFRYDKKLKKLRQRLISMKGNLIASNPLL